MVMDTLGLAISVGLNTAFRNSQRASFLLPLAVLPICGLGDLMAIYAELKSTHLRSLNRERAELLAEAWLTRRQVLTAQQVSAALYCSAPMMRRDVSARLQGVHGGCGVSRVLGPAWSMGPGGLGVFAGRLGLAREGTGWLCVDGSLRLEGVHAAGMSADAVHGWEAASLHQSWRES